MPPKPNAPIRRGAEADRRGDGGRERDAGVEFLAEGMVDRPPPVAIRDMAAIVFERHGLRLTAAVEHRLAELAGIACPIGVDGPARLPGVDGDAELAGVVDRGLDRSDLVIVMTADNPDTGRLQLCNSSFQRPPGCRRCDSPTVGFKNRELARLRRGWRRRRTIDARKARIAAGALRGFVRHLPRRRQASGARTLPAIGPPARTPPPIRP